MNEWIRDFKSTVELEKNALERFLNRFENSSTHPDFSKNIEKCIEIFLHTLSQNGKIIVTGMGKSGKIASKISATLCSTGSFAVFLHPSEGLHGDLGLIQKNDCVLAISQSGNTLEITNLIPSFLQSGIPIIAISGNEHSLLVEKSSAWINSHIEKEACPHNLAPTVSTTLALAIGDALAIALMKARNFKIENFASNHPGGALGKKLTLKVADLMHSSEKLDFLAPSAGIEKIVSVLTEKKMGAVCILENGKFLGIITDGDLRRALKRKSEFFQLQAKDIMCLKPTLVFDDELATTALELMENRPSQISVLPVFNRKNEWKGMLRLHDIVKNF